MKNKRMKISSVLAITCICLLGLTGCSGSTVKDDGDGGVYVGNSGGSCSVRVIEIEGSKYVLAVGYNKCAICPAVNQDLPNDLHHLEETTGENLCYATNVD